MTSTYRRRIDDRLKLFQKHLVDADQVELLVTHFDTAKDKELAIRYQGTVT